MMVRFVSNGNTTNTASVVVTANSAYYFNPGYITLANSYVLGTKFTIGILIKAGTVKFFYNNMVTPVVTAPFVKPCDTNAFKVRSHYCMY